MVATIDHSTSNPALIVLGRDAAGRSHASWFDESQVEPAHDAAEVMGMTTLPVSSDDLRSLAGDLARGKLFASGKAFVPFVNGTLFSKLTTHLSDEQRSEIEASRMGEVAAGVSDGKRPEPPHLPEDWSKLTVGSLVVACESADGGWWLARIVKVASENSFTLKWLDYPDDPAVNRQRKHIALLHPEAGASWLR
ncbi:hypothetical protein [Amorphus coralli]|uniref:hypothetical protein n=1 Tax=Amorphus coralli TaxID=340680 RepID=UPI00036EA007|nr:hypothetical protein [Amorphus coralli]